MKLVLAAATVVGALALARGETGAAKQVHLFRGAKYAWGMTYDETGKNLPQDYAPWQLVKSMNRSDPRFKSGKDKRDLAEVDAKGYAVSIITVSISQ